MGRYYYGDIEGKFAVGIQDSDAADRFGVVGERPYTLEYYFGEMDLENVTKELKEIEEKLGDKIQKIRSFFDDKQFYDMNELCEHLDLNEEKTNRALSEYSDYILGKKIEQCIKDIGYCSFSAEM